MCNHKGNVVVWLRLSVTLVYMAAILFMSSIPGVIPDDAPALYSIFTWIYPSIQNLMHVPVYAGLAVLWCGVLNFRSSGFWRLAGACLITVGFGVFDEWFQSFIPGRYASAGDVMANALGAVIGVGVFSCVWGENTRMSNRYKEWRAKLRGQKKRNRA